MGWMILTFLKNLINLKFESLIYRLVDLSLYQVFILSWDAKIFQKYVPYEKISVIKKNLFSREKNDFPNIFSKP